MIDGEEIQKIVVTCMPGLEEVLTKEIEDLGYPIISKRSKAITTEGVLEDTYKLNLWLRTGSSVLLRIAAFKAAHPDQLYKRAINIPWGIILDKSGYFSIDSFVRNQHINDNRFANLKLKDAIADYFMKKYNSRPDSGPSKEGVSFYIHWIEDDVAIYIDTSGTALTRRGYRIETGPAPLNEALAAGIVLSSNWDRRSPFINPMTGTGTLTIEAALIAYNIAPGLLRNEFSFFYLKNFEKDKWSKLFEAANKAIKKEGPQIIGTDKSRRIIQSAVKNSKKAGVDNLITYYACDFANTKIPEEKGGVVVFNPEYGERLGDLTELEGTYARIGDFLKQECSGNTGYVFTGNLDLGKRVGLKTYRKLVFFNAKIECRLLEYNLYDGSKEIT